jgi:hypothetical protein
VQDGKKRCDCKAWKSNTKSFKVLVTVSADLHQSQSIPDISIVFRPHQTEEHLKFIKRRFKRTLTKNMYTEILLGCPDFTRRVIFPSARRHAVES